MSDRELRRLAVPIHLLDNEPQAGRFLGWPVWLVLGFVMCSFLANNFWWIWQFTSNLIYFLISSAFSIWQIAHGSGYLSDYTGSRLLTVVSGSLGPAIDWSLGVGSVLLVAVWSWRPKFVRLRADGFEFGRKRVLGGEGRARFVSWDTLKKVRTIGAFKWDYKLLLEGERGELLRLSSRELRSCMDEGLFLNAIKTWAPDAVLECSFATSEYTLTGPSYTQLWFKYFSTPANRQRKSQLEDGVVVGKGNFKVVGHIATGGQGTAYLAVPTDPECPHQEVVLKEYILPVHRGTTVMEHTKGKLMREADILRVIEHEQIVQIIDAFFEDFRGYLVMEYVEGKSLKQLVECGGPQSEKFVLEMAVQMCNIVGYLHSLSPAIIHRDLTPDNFILQPNGLLKLVDFNVAHELEPSATATVVGKQAYIPPEQFRGQATPQSDIYAIGCTLFYLLIGAEPEPISVSHPRDHREGVSKEMDRIVSTATTPDAHDRYATIAEMRNDLLVNSSIELR